MNKVDLIGYLAAIFGTGMSLPQLLKIVKTKHAKDVSLYMFVLSLIGTALWFYYGLLTNSWPVIVANVIAFGFSLTIIFLKLKYS